MKKTSAILLALSLLANVALAIALARSNATSDSSSGSAGKKSSPAATRASDSAIVAAAQSGDINALLSHLKASGISDKTARFMAAGLEFQKFADQMLELTPPEEYWRNRNAAQSPEARQKMQQMMVGLQRNMMELLSEAMPQINNNRYAYLSPERRAQLRQLEKDYDDLNMEMMTNASGFRLASDSENMKALAEERKREIDQFLTPDEIAARDMRESSAARLIRNEYGNAINSEAEYQTVYNLMKAAGDDKAAQDAARAQIEATLGADRMAQLYQMNDPDYDLIQSAVARLNLPAAETGAALTDIRSQAEQASAAISANNALSAAQKKAALEDLAAKSQEQMTAVLGAEGAETYASRSTWVRSLKQGSSFSIDAKGRFQSAGRSMQIQGMGVPAFRW